jgi:hypothetical protein
VHASIKRLERKPLRNVTVRLVEAPQAIAPLLFDGAAAIGGRPRPRLWAAILSGKKTNADNAAEAA